MVHQTTNKEDNIIIANEGVLSPNCSDCNPLSCNGTCPLHCNELFVAPVSQSTADEDDINMKLQELISSSSCSYSQDVEFDLRGGDDLVDNEKQQPNTIIASAMHPHSAVIRHNNNSNRPLYPKDETIVFHCDDCEGCPSYIGNNVRRLLYNNSNPPKQTPKLKKNKKSKYQVQVSESESFECSTLEQNKNILPNYTLRKKLPLDKGHRHCTCLKCSQICSDCYALRLKTIKKKYASSTQQNNLISSCGNDNKYVIQSRGGTTDNNDNGCRGKPKKVMTMTRAINQAEKKKLNNHPVVINNNNNNIPHSTENHQQHVRIVPASVQVFKKRRNKRNIDDAPLKNNRSSSLVVEYEKKFSKSALVRSSWTEIPTSGQMESISSIIKDACCSPEPSHFPKCCPSVVDKSSIWNKSTSSSVINELNPPKQITSSTSRNTQNQHHQKGQSENGNNLNGNELETFLECPLCQGSGMVVAQNLNVFNTEHQNNPCHHKHNNKTHLNSEPIYAN